MDDSSKGSLTEDSHRAGKNLHSRCQRMAHALYLVLGNLLALTARCDVGKHITAMLPDDILVKNIRFLRD